MGRELMYNPFWLLHAAQILGVDPDFNLWPEQYRWGVNRRSKIEKYSFLLRRDLSGIIGSVV